MMATAKAEITLASDQIRNGNIRIPFDILEAMRWANATRSSFRLTPEAFEFMGDRWDAHPDKGIVEKWLREKGQSDNCQVIRYVSAHVISEWLTLPKRTKNQHNKLFNDIAGTAKALRALIEQTGSYYFRGGGHGLQGARLCELFTDEESSGIAAVVDAWNEQHPVTFEHADGRVEEMVVNAWEYFPTVEELLERVAAAAERIAGEGPIHSQPNKRGAMTGYFVRRMGSLLIARFGEAPPPVIAAISAIALGEAIDEDLTRKHLSLSERSLKNRAHNVPKPK